jgi:hypothetical protein
LLSRKEFVVAAQKSDKSKAQNGKGGLMGLVAKLLGVVAISLGTLFFAAMFDIGHAGLIHTLAGPAAILVPLFAVLSIGAMFLTPKSTADLDEQEAQIAALSEFQSKMKSQILTLQNQMDSMSGQDVEALRARNKELQEELDAIHQAEREKMDVEVDALRPVSSDCAAASAMICAASPSRIPGDGARAGTRAGNEMRHLGDIGPGIALQEEVLRGCRAEALVIGDLDIVLAHVLGPKQPARAMHLDALVIAVGGAARIGDLADLARGGGQHRAAVSTSPASPIAGSTSADPVAKT